MNNPEFNNTLLDINFDSLRQILPENLIDRLKKEYVSLDVPIETNNKKDELIKESNINFNFNMVNSNADLKKLVNKLKKSKTSQYSLLLYGVSGSGKSYFGKYLGQELNMPVISKKANDLTDRFVGETEKNIHNAFEEARKNNAILIFDEADSFLFDRKYAQQQFQVSHVNAMLTEMENHPLPFICTTNLKESIDKASLRRFIFKIKYDYMNTKNIVSGIKSFFNIKVTTKEIDSNKLLYLCPGDFVVAKKKLDILENSKYTKENVIEYLKKEQDEKEIKISNSIGFNS